MSNVLLPFVVVALSYRNVLANPKLSVGDNCFLGSGFDYLVGCGKASALSSPLVKCTGSEEGPCIDSEDTSDETAYTMDVRSQGQYNTLLEATVSAEGSGFGYKVSAGVSYLQQSQATEKSIAFFLGQSGTVRTETVRGTQHLKLNPQAKSLLQSCSSQSKCDFISEYGKHYVYSITYGRSFLGGFNLWDKNESQTQSLSLNMSAMANYSAMSLFTDNKVNASARFETQLSSSNEHLEKVVNARWVGGEGLALDPSSPEGMYKTYLKWQESSKDHPVKLTMAYRDWRDSDDVVDFLNGKPQEIQELFTPQAIGETVNQQITQEWGKTHYTYSAVQHALMWKSTLQLPAFKNELRELGQNCTTHLSNMQSFGEDDILARQDEINNNNYSWFIAEDLLDTYRNVTNTYLAMITSNPEKKCYAPCGSWCCDDHPGYDTCCSQFGFGQVDGSCAKTGNKCCTEDFSCPPDQNCYPHEKACCPQHSVGCPQDGKSSGTCCKEHSEVCCSAQGYNGCCPKKTPVCGASQCCPSGYKVCGDRCCKGSGKGLAFANAVPKSDSDAGHAGDPHIFMPKKATNASIVLFF